MKPKFLVIEDDPDIRNLLEAMLNSFGCEVVLAEDGYKGLAEIDTKEKAQTFSAVMLDIMMQGISGFGVIEHIRRTPHTRKLPVVMLTALGSEADMITGYNFGADYYIPKPFTREQLIYGLDIVLGTGDKEDSIEHES